MVIKQEKSMIQVAFEMLSKRKRGVKFEKIFEEVCNTLKIPEEERVSKISYFYTQLSLDGRFMSVKEDTWDLKERYTSEEAKVDIEEVDDEEVDDETDRVKELGEEDEDENEGVESDDDYVKNAKVVSLDGYDIVDDQDN